MLTSFKWLMCESEINFAFSVFVLSNITPLAEQSFGTFDPSSLFEQIVTSTSTRSLVDRTVNYACTSSHDLSSVSSCSQCVIF